MWLRNQSCPPPELDPSFVLCVSISPSDLFSFQLAKCKPSTLPSVFWWWVLGLCRSHTEFLFCFVSQWGMGRVNLFCLQEWGEEQQRFILSYLKDDSLDTYNPMPFLWLFFSLNYRKFRFYHFANGINHNDICVNEHIALNTGYL